MVSIGSFHLELDSIVTVPSIASVIVMPSPLAVLRGSLGGVPEGEGSAVEAAGAGKVSAGVAAGFAQAVLAAPSLRSVRAQPQSRQVASAVHLESIPLHASMPQMPSMAMLQGIPPASAASCPLAPFRIGELGEPRQAGAEPT